LRLLRVRMKTIVRWPNSIVWIPVHYANAPYTL